ncbi:MAG: hypothetical protein IJ862_01340 [Selenomonadaceae bacterium]|nr:hypothetical protein [Selenomonadaceae bacterium]
MWLKKKTLALLFMLMMIVGVGEAATAETINNGEELARMQRLAIAYPDYYQSLDKEPTINEFINVLYEAGKVSKSKIISYDEMANKIKQSTGIDIRVIPKKEARKIFKEHVYKYADGYVFFTLANNSRLNLFCEVYVPNTNELAYVLRVEAGKSDESKNAKNYKTMAEEFYRAFDKAVQTELKKKEKE